MNFQSGNCSGEVLADENNWIFTVNGKCPGAKSLEYLAPTTPDIRESYSGSGLPFPTELIAFDNTPNYGKIELPSNGQFQFKIIRPNSFYINNGSTLVKPHIKMIVDQRDLFEIQLEPIPYRSLKHLPGRQRRTVGR